MATRATSAPLLIKLSSRGLDSISGEVVYFLELRKNESVQILMKFFRLVIGFTLFGYPLDRSW